MIQNTLMGHYFPWFYNPTIDSYEDIEDKDREIDAYYVSDTGEFVRIIEKDGEKIPIGIDEPGFKDKPKKK